MSPSWPRGHAGLDFNGETGDPVYAATDGRVEYAEFNYGGYGNLVMIMRADGTQTRYAHLDKIKVRKGEQIRFLLRNNGEIDHEFVIGTVEDNRKHMKAMESHPDMEHDDPNAKRLKPKATGEIVWQFTKAGTFEFACLIPGHYPAGMVGTITVE